MNPKERGTLRILNDRLLVDITYKENDKENDQGDPNRDYTGYVDEWKEQDRDCTRAFHGQEDCRQVHRQGGLQPGCRYAGQ